MGEPQKPFACSVAECGMSFTNEDHLHVHSKKHDMVLQLGLEQKAAFVADQTPTPTRFIRNCEEVGLFQDLQHVSENPFDEGFKKAMETKQGILCLENAIAASSSASDDVLHTPQMTFPLQGDPTLFSSTQRTTISRSSSDESGTIKGETTISSNEITISRTICNRDGLDKITTKDTTVVKNTDITEKSVNETIFSKNVTKTVIKDGTKIVVATKDVMLADVNKLQVPEKQQIMSQRSLDFVVDSLTSEVNENQNDRAKINETNNMTKRLETKLILVNDDMSKVLNNVESTSGCVMKVPRMTSKLIPKPAKVKSEPVNKLPKLEPKPSESNTFASENIEVFIKLPNGKRVKMKAMNETNEPDNKQIIRKNIINKSKTKGQTKQHKLNNIYVNASKILNNQVSIGASFQAVNVAKLPNQSNVIINKNITTQNSNIPAIILSEGKTKLPVLINSEGNIIVTSDISVSQSTECNTSNENINQSVLKPERGAQLANDKTKRKISERQNEIEADLDSNGAAKNTEDSRNTKRSKFEMESRSAASKRYRERLKHQMANQQAEIGALREANRRLIAEKAALKLLITEHMKTCPQAEILPECMPHEAPTHLDCSGKANGTVSASHEACALSGSTQ